MKKGFKSVLTLRRTFRILKEKDRNENTKEKDVTRQLHLQAVTLQGSLRFLLCTSTQNRLHPNLGCKHESIGNLLQVFDGKQCL